MTPELEALLKRIRACLLTCFDSDADELELPQVRTVIRGRISDIDAALAEHKAKADQAAL